MSSLTGIDPVGLRTLAAALRLGTFDAAAHELHVTPSAVSQRIKALENRVGRVLVHRVKPLEPTEAGHVLVRLAAQVELLEREAVAELVEGSADDEEARYASVPLAVNADALYSWLVEAMVRVQHDGHRVTFELLREDETRTAELLRRGEVMAAVSSDPRPVPGCRVVRLGRMRYRGVATPEWVAAHLPDGAVPTDLGRAPVLCFDRNDTLQHGFLRKVTRRHLAPPVTFIPSVGEYASAVRRGLGWGCLPEREALTDVEQGRLVEIAPGRHADVALYWQHWRLESPMMADLTASVVAAAGEWFAG